MPTGRNCFDLGRGLRGGTSRRPRLGVDQSSVGLTFGTTKWKTSLT